MEENLFYKSNEIINKISQRLNFYQQIFVTEMIGNVSLIKIL